MTKHFKSMHLYLLIFWFIAGITFLGVIFTDNAAANDNGCSGWPDPKQYDSVFKPEDHRRIGSLFCNVENIEVYGITDPLNYKVWKSFKLAFTAPVIKQKWHYKCTREEEKDENLYTCESESSSYAMYGKCIYYGDKFITWTLKLHLEPGTGNAQESVCDQAFQKTGNFNFYVGDH